MSESTRMKWALDGNIATVQIAEDTSAEFDVSRLTDEEVLNNIRFYGVKQKLADSCARRKDETLTSAEKKAQMEDVFERLVSGDWNQKEISRTNKLKDAIESRPISDIQLLVDMGIITQTKMDNEVVRRRNLPKEEAA